MMKKPGSRKYGSALEQDAALTPIERLQIAYPHLDFAMDKSPYFPGLKIASPTISGGTKGTLALYGMSPGAAMAFVPRPIRIVDRSLGSRSLRGRQTYAPFDDYLIDEDVLADTGNYELPKDALLQPASEIDAIDLKRGEGLGSEAYPPAWEYSRMMGWPNLSNFLTPSNESRRPVNMINGFARGMTFRNIVPHSTQKFQNLPFTQRDLMALNQEEQLGLLLADERDGVLHRMFGPQSVNNGWTSDVVDLGQDRRVTPLQALSDEETAAKNARRIKDQLSLYVGQIGASPPYGATSLRRSAIVDSVDQALLRGIPDDEIAGYVDEFHPAVTRNIFKKHGGLVRGLGRTKRY
jgi:hypothetical protein